MKMRWREFKETSFCSELGYVVSYHSFSEVWFAIAPGWEPVGEYQTANEAKDACQQHLNTQVKKRGFPPAE